MQRVSFEQPLTALEIRDPIIAICQHVAEEADLHVAFEQPQQPAFEGYSGQRGRKRVGNGKHKNWFVNFQSDPPQVSRPKVLGRIHILSPVIPNAMQFGGFDYGKYGQSTPTYTEITLKDQVASEFQHWKPEDIDRGILRAAELLVVKYFDPELQQPQEPAEPALGQGQLF